MLAESFLCPEREHLRLAYTFVCWAFCRLITVHTQDEYSTATEHRPTVGAQAQAPNDALIAAATTPTKSITMRRMLVVLPRVVTASHMTADGKVHWAGEIRCGFSFSGLAKRAT